MLLGFNYGQYYSHAYALNQYFASKGYIVISLNFRSGIGYGLNFREAENYGATGASEFYDVLGTGLYLKNRDDVDPDKITLWGGSYGGYLTAMALSRASDLFACGVDIHGVHDWNEGIRNFVPSYVPEKCLILRHLHSDHHLNTLSMAGSHQCFLFMEMMIAMSILQKRCAWQSC